MMMMMTHHLIGYDQTTQTYPKLNGICAMKKNKAKVIVEEDWLMRKSEYTAERELLELYTSDEFKLKSTAKSRPFSVNSYDGKACSTIYRKFVKLYLHYAGHSGLMFSCQKCGKNYIRTLNLRKHFKEGVHNGKVVESRGSTLSCNMEETEFDRRGDVGASHGKLCSHSLRRYDRTFGLFAEIFWRT